MSNSIAPLAIHPRRIFRAQLAIILFLGVANLVLHFTFLWTGHNRIFGLRRLFDLDGEWNIPSVYSALVILACAAAMIAAAIHARRRQRQDPLAWLFLAVVFVYLAYDELFSVHETLPAPSLGGAVGRGLLYNPWVAPGTLFVLVVFALSVMFLRRLPARTRRLMVTSGATYVAGALGFEALGGLRFEAEQLELAPGRMDVTFVLLFTCEELLEMLGMALFLFAVRDHELARSNPVAAVHGGSC